MNTRTLFKAAVITLGVMVSATVAEAMPASVSLGTAPVIAGGQAQVQTAALVVVTRRVMRRPRIIVRRPRMMMRRRIIVR